MPRSFVAVSTFGRVQGSAMTCLQSLERIRKAPVGSATRTLKLERCPSCCAGCTDHNIFSSPRIAIETDESAIDLQNNLIREVGGYFVDAVKGDLHLTGDASDAFGKATAHPDVTDDIDQQPRKDAPDLGADEGAP